MLLFTNNLVQPIAIPHKPDITRLYEKPVPSKRRAILLVQGETSFVNAWLTDIRGDPIDLSAYLGPNFTVGVAIGDSITQVTHAVYDVCTVIDPVRGSVTGPVNKKVTAHPGVYICQLALTDDTIYPRAISTGEVIISMGNVGNNYVITSNLNTYVYPKNVSPWVGIGTILTFKQQLVKNVNVVYSNIIYLYIDPGIYGNLVGIPSGLPMLAEIRLHLRDYPEVNVLLDDYEFDEAEIAFAASRCINYFNEIPPVVLRKFDTKNFPWRYFWLEGICFQLFMIASNYFRRNRLPYQAGGLSIDDLSKEKEYLQAAQAYGESWKNWVRMTKIQINADEGWGSVGSDYLFAGNGW